MNHKKQAAKESVQDAISRLKANKKQQISLPSDQNIGSPTSDLTTEYQTKPKASKNTLPVSASERTKVANAVIKQMLFGEITQGQALKTLRVNILGLKQDVYAKLVGVSRKTLSDIENDRSNYSTEVLNKVFKPFGLKVGLLPSSPSLLNSFLRNRDTE